MLVNIKYVAAADLNPRLEESINKLDRASENIEQVKEGLNEINEGLHPPTQSNYYHFDYIVIIL